MRKGLALLFILSFAGMGYSLRTEVDGAMAFIHPVFLWSDKTALNQILSAQGFTTFNSMDFGVGVGVCIAVENIFLGWNGQIGLFPQIVENSTSGNTITSDFACHFIDIGFVPVGSYDNDWWLAVSLSVGWKRLGLDIAPASITNTDFYQILSTPSTFTSLVAHRFSVGLSLTFNWLPDDVGFTARVGYHYTPLTVWQVQGGGFNRANLNQAPSLGEHSVVLLIGVSVGEFDLDQNYDYRYQAPTTGSK